MCGVPIWGQYGLDVLIIPIYLATWCDTVKFVLMLLKTMNLKNNDSPVMECLHHRLNINQNLMVSSINTILLQVKIF